MPLSRQAFLQTARQAALDAIPGPRPEARLRSSMLQLYFGDPRQHYELWLRPQAGLVEIGLHFEGEREDSLARIAAVAEKMPLVAPRLGPLVEVEEWTERWTRVHETLPLPPLDEANAVKMGRRLALYVEVLEPVVADLPPMAPRPPREQRGPSRWERARARRAARPPL